MGGEGNILFNSVGGTVEGNMPKLWFFAGIFLFCVLFAGMISEAAIGGSQAYPFPQLAVYTVEEHGV